MAMRISAKVDHKTKVALLLMAIAYEERQVEITREVLAEQFSFVPFQAFRRLDRRNKAAINANDLHLFLQQNGVVHNKFECACMIRALSSALYNANADVRTPT